MFKACKVFEVAPESALELSALGGMLAGFRFVPCSGSEASRVGFVSGPGLESEGEGDGLAIVTSEVAAFWFQEESKILPPSAVSRRVKDRVKEIEAAQGNKVGRKQKKEIKEIVIEEMLPQALSRVKTIPCLLDLGNRYFYVGSSSEGAVDSVTSLMSKALGVDGIWPFTKKV